MYDIAIIGAGVTGCAIARELSRYEARICVVERCSDVCEGTSKANSAIVHAGYDAPAGSVKARMNVAGNERMEALCRELDVPFRRIGSLVICMEEERLPELQALYDRGMANGVQGLQILDRVQTLELEPGLSDEVRGALFAPSAGIVCPFELTIALAENAAENGVEFRLNAEVTGIVREENGYRIRTEKGDMNARMVVNAAGVYADALHNMVSSQKIHITPRRGEYCLLDSAEGELVKHTIFPLPAKSGKGILVTPTVHGNILLGPTAVDIEEKEGTNTTREGLETVLDSAARYVKKLPPGKVITSFAGLRACEDGHEFLLGEVEGAPGFFDAAGIESPGLTSAPAIGEFMAELLQRRGGWEQKKAFTARRQGIRRFVEQGPEEQQRMLKENPAYGTIVCRCEKVTEGEILDAIRRPLGAVTLDGIKRRTRAGMGRCQSGFCSPRVMEILASELHADLGEITKCGGNSRMTAGRTRETDDENI